MPCQPGILAPVAPAATFLRLDRRHGVDAHTAFATLRRPSPHVLVGLGPAFLAALGAPNPSLRPIPTLTAAGLSTPSTPSDVWLRITGDDPGSVLHRLRALDLGSFRVADQTQAFRHRSGHDLSGYEDGTENPTGSDAERVAFDGETAMVAVQRWVHDWPAFDAMSPTARNHAIGRDRESNEELDDAPASAHVKRTAQEDFEPEAFVVRRSMPWSDARGSGLYFVSFSATLDPFEAQLRRMMGRDDGITDGLFAFTRPVDGATFWLPGIDATGALDVP